MPCTFVVPWIHTAAAPNTHKNWHVQTEDVLHCVLTAWASAFSRRLQSCMPSLHATDLGKACIAAAHLRLDMGE
eukprot:scaffold60028_cov16-Tisochrysis_lutea.AAC.1